MQINIFKSLGVWDHIPTADELRDQIDPGTDQLFYKTAPKKAKTYIDMCGFSLSYNNSKRYFSEVLYYIDISGKVITTDLTIMPNIKLI